MIHPDLRGIKTLIFDMDGTLIASGRTALHSLRSGLEQFYAKLGKPVPEYSDEELVAGIGAPSDDFYRTLLRPEDRDRMDDFRNAILGNEKEFLSTHRITFPGVIKTLKELKRRGYRMAVVSNCHTPYLNTVMETQRLGIHFDRLSCVGDFPGATKSNLIAAAVKELGGPAVVIGDRYYDVDGALENGLPAVGALYGYGTREELSKTATWVEDIRDLLDLFNPIRESASRIAAEINERRPLDRPFIVSLSAPHPAMTKTLRGWLLTELTDRNVPVTLLDLTRYQNSIKSKNPETCISEVIDWKKLDREILAASPEGKVDSTWTDTMGESRPYRARPGSVLIVNGPFLPNDHLATPFDLSIRVEGNDAAVRRTIKRNGANSASTALEIEEWKNHLSVIHRWYGRKLRALAPVDFRIDGSKPERMDILS